MRNFYLTFLMMLVAGVRAVADDWMARLPDRLYVCQVSIPGSHDTATGNGFNDPLGTSFAQTQDIDMSAQWASGIRAFDLRPIVKDDHLHINHGIIETKLRFDSALYLLRDSLKAHPSEFAIVHLLYADGYDTDKDTYASMLSGLAQSDELKDYLVDFRRDLTVGDMRGKILLLSRDEYLDKPIGGFFKNWCGYIDWNVQTQGRIVGPGTGADNTGYLYMQDFSDTHESGALDTKTTAIKTMLNFSTKHEVDDPSQIVWVYNFASAYSKVLLGIISTSDGYRDNATYTNAAILDYFDKNEAGPAGIVLMDYVGVDQSGTYATLGRKVVDTLIANNFKYLDRMNEDVYATKSKEIAGLNTRMATARRLISNSYSDVAADFEDELVGLEQALADLQTETDRLYAASQLFPDTFTIDTDSLAKGPLTRW
ncbi:MAG: hypothetical protein LUC45_09625 [Paraprevotella sp.]|nr:hypothetical protein [Paraprevotella sp.]